METNIKSPKLEGFPHNPEKLPKKPSMLRSAEKEKNVKHGTIDKSKNTILDFSSDSDEEIETVENITEESVIRKGRWDWIKKFCCCYCTPMSEYYFPDAILFKY